MSVGRWPWICTLGAWASPVLSVWSPLRVAARWKAPTRPALVLVTNTSVEQEAVQGWKALASSLDLELAIWDLSYYGFLPLGTAFSDRSDAHFAADPNVHAVVLLGGAFTAPLEDADGRRLQVRSAMFLDEDGLLRATAHAGLGVLMVGGSEPMSADAGGQGDLLAGATSGFAGRDHDSPAAFLDWLDEQDATRADLGSVHSVAVGEVPWHSDAQLYPAEVGLALLEDLRKRWPSRRYRTLVHEGRIVVELLEDLERARLVYVRSTDEELRLKTTATAPHVLGSLVGSLRFERKLALLQRFLEGDLPLGELSPETLGNAIAEAVVRDLKNEADVWQREAGSGFDTAGTYRERMRLHHALGTLKLKAPVEVVGPRGRCALRILSAIKACGSRWGASDVWIPFAARRYLVAAAIAGTRTQSGLADEFGEGVFGSEFDVSEHVAPEPAAAYWSRTFTPGAGLFLVAGELEAKRAPVREGARARAAYLAGHERMLSESFMAEELDAGQ